MGVSLPLLPMYYLLRKRNLKKEIEGVLKMLKIICYFQGGMTILAFFSTIPLDISDLEELMANREMEEMWVSIAILAFYAITVLFTFIEIHGIWTQNRRYVTAFIIFQYTSFAFIAAGVTAYFLYLSIILSQFWIFILGVLIVMCITFVYIFDMGPIITLNTFFGEKERNGNIYTKMEEVNGA